MQSDNQTTTLIRQVNSNMNNTTNMNRSIFLLTAFIISFGVMSCSKKDSAAPVLIVATNTGFGTYTGEILKAEGYNEFQMDSLADAKISLKYLRKFDLIILTESSLIPAQKLMFTTFVKGGGNLIAFKPDKKLSEVFGIIYEGGSFRNAYLSVNANSDIGNGITTETIQLHVDADKFKLNGGMDLADFFLDATNTSGLPGLVFNNYGKGHTIAVLYNLPENIVYTRQGNCQYAGQEKDGINGLRPMDLFTDGWVDTSKSTINQADEQMVLLSHCIEKMNTYTSPLPHLWYFPDTLKCLVTLTNDGESRSDIDFEPQFRDIDSMGAKMSIYILDINKVSKEWVDKWTAKGHEIAGHPDDVKEAGNPDWNNMNNAIRMKKNEIAGKYGLPMRTNVNHWFVWCGRNADGKPDFAAEARLEEKNGIELDINYAQYDLKSNQAEHFLGPPGTNQGNFTGSGLLMKFADARGKIINVYQHLNAVYDQEYNESHDPEGFYNCFRGLMDRSLHSEVYSFISVKSHNDEYYFSRIPLMKMLAYASKNGVPVWTALKLLDFIKMRDEATFTDISWSDNRLSFNLNSSLKHSNGLTFMVPFKYRDKRITGVTRNGKDATFIIRSVKGSDYAFITVEPGANYSILVTYGK